MSLLEKTKRVTFKKDTGVVYFINEEGDSTHALYIKKGYLLKEEDFVEIMESMEIRFKKKKP